MKKVLPILVLMILAVSFFSCDNDGDGCYDFEDRSELSVEESSTEVDSSDN